MAYRRRRSFRGRRSFRSRRPRVRRILTRRVRRRSRRVGFRR